MRTDDFDYNLPDELIAQAPAEPRDSCRLLVLNRELEGGAPRAGDAVALEHGGSVGHRRFYDIPMISAKAPTRRASCRRA